jgi:adenylate cyclase class 2
MKFEVEKKYWVDDFDPLLCKLRGLNAHVHDTVDQADQYFAHPTRDFSKTDEVLRLRRVGNKNFVTYKGARIDSTTKTRQELEFSLHDGEDAERDFAQLLKVLGFCPVMTVRKRRTIAHCPWEDEIIEVAMDEIDQLGLFVELEITSDAEHLDAAKQHLTSLAARLELTRLERRSYLELLLHQLADQIVPRSGDHCA